MRLLGKEKMIGATPIEGSILSSGYGMTITHEFSSPIWVQTPLGPGRAILMIDYGIDHNPIFLVQLDDGRFKSIDSNDCRAFENLTFGIKRPEPPPGGETA
jgi:hypothetical protein